MQDLQRLASAPQSPITKYFPNHRVQDATPMRSREDARHDRNEVLFSSLCCSFRVRTDFSCFGGQCHNLADRNADGNTESLEDSRMMPSESSQSTATDPSSPARTARACVRCNADHMVSETGQRPASVDTMPSTEVCGHLRNRFRIRLVHMSLRNIFMKIGMLELQVMASPCFPVQHLVYACT